MSTHTQASGPKPHALAAPRLQSPLRFLFALLTRLRAVDGPSMESDLALEALHEEQLGLGLCHDCSVEVETALARYNRQLSEAWADGVLTLREKAQLARALLRLKRSAHATTTQLELLS